MFKKEITERKCDTSSISDIKPRGSYIDVTNNRFEKVLATDAERKYPVLSESSLLNKVSSKKACQSSVLETFSEPFTGNLFVSSESKCNNTDETSFTKFICTKCGLGSPCSIFICRRIESFNNIKKSYSQPNENHGSTVVPDNLVKSKVCDITLLSKCESNTKSSIFSFDNQEKCISSNKENNMQCKNDLNKSSLNFESPKSHSLICDTGALNSSVLKDGFNSSQICSGKMLSFQNSFDANKLIEEQSSEMPFESLSQGTHNFLSELAASGSPVACNDNVSGCALTSLNSPFSCENKKATTVNDFNSKLLENECLSNSNDEIILKSNDTELPVLREKIESALKREKISESNENDIFSLKNVEDMSNSNDEIILKSNDTELPVLSEQIESMLKREKISESNENDISSLKNVEDMSGFINVTKSISKDNYELDNQNNTLASNMNVSVSNMSDGFVDENKETSETDESMLASNAPCNDAVNKDITSALDLIEQCSLHDQNLSSAEICNSLNNIFSEANVGLSASAISNVQCSQSVETGTDYETITLQTVESDAASAIVGDVTINLADLGLGDNPELLQQIYLVQDESGNIQTVLLLPDDAQIVENVVVDAEQGENVATDAEQLENVEADAEQGENNAADAEQGENNAADAEQGENNAADAEKEDVAAEQLENVVADAEQLENVAADAEQLENVPADSEQLENVPADSEQLENVPADSEQLENVASDSEQLENVPADAEQGENVAADVEEGSALKDNIESAQTDQHFIFNNTSDYISDVVKKMLVNEKILENAEKNLTAEKDINDHEHQLNSENTFIDMVLQNHSKIENDLLKAENQHENNERNSLNGVSGKRTFLQKEIMTSSALVTKDERKKDFELKELLDAENNKDSTEHLKNSVESNMNELFAFNLESEKVKSQHVKNSVKAGMNEQFAFNLESEEDDSQISVTVPENYNKQSNSISNSVNYPNKLLYVVESESCKTDQNIESLHNSKLNKDNNLILSSSRHSSELFSSNNLNTLPPVSKAKKRCSSGSSNPKSFLNVNQNNPVLFNGIFSSVSNKISPKNGAVYHSETDLTQLNSHCNDASSSSKYQHTDTKLFQNQSVQKSKKTFINNSLNRSAKKSFFPASKISSGSLHMFSPSQTSTIYDSLASSSFKGITIDSEHLLALKNIIFKRGLEGEIDIEQISKRPKNDNVQSTSNTELIDNFNGVYLPKTRSVALKTFKKPFTAAKKSIFEPRESSRKLNTALKTCVPRTVAIQSARKTFSHLKSKDKPKHSLSTDRDLPKVNVKLGQNQLNSSESNVYFQPEVCEIRILPNDYVKRASDLLLKANAVDPASSPEENVSEEDVKSPSECISPLEDIIPLKYHCTCTEQELPCLCNEGNLQINCEAEDTVDDKNVPCTNHVSKQYLLTPSSEIKHRAFCDIHLWRLRQHHCCPKCGIFCSQGDFLLCTYDDAETRENHLFHPSCSIVPSPGLPPGCPHCCKFSNFTPVKLIYRCAEEEQRNLPYDAQNITSGIKNCSVYLTVNEDVSTEAENHSDMFVPHKKEVQLMITSLAKDKALRLRPTGKCLYNPIKTGDVQKVMQLIGNGVNPNHKFRMHRNDSPLHVAAHYGWTGILHILLQAGAYIASVNDDLETPLIVAVEKNQLPIVRYLVLAGAQIDVKDCNGMTSFHIASKNGFKEIAEFLYDTGRIDVNLQDDGGWTALVWACEHKHLDFVKWLLEIGADPNVRDNEENTVLHWAAYSGKREIAELLLDKGCTLSYVNRRGDSALHIAAREDNYECVKLFINRGAVVDQKNKENKTPLMCCQDDSLSFNYLIQSISSGTLKIGKLQLEKHVVFRDISRGAEAYPIQAVNEVDDEEFIMEFRYVVKPCHRSGVDIIRTVNNMQFCYCKDNCLTRDCNCTMNSACWYDVNGCLTSEYDLQNTPAIFECNKTCHCPKTCINRVVQHGLRFPLQIFRTQFQGWGVRALQDIPKGAFVCEYVGELITGKEAVQRSDDTYLFDLQSQDSDYCLDGRYFGNVARFLNHSCEPNLIALKVFVDHQDMNFPRIAFFAFKEIQASEELCFDYGLDFWLVKCQTILCTCNTQSCKYSKDTIDDTLWKFFKDTSNGAQFTDES